MNQGFSPLITPNYAELYRDDLSLAMVVRERADERMTSSIGFVVDDCKKIVKELKKNYPELEIQMECQKIKDKTYSQFIDPDGHKVLIIQRQPRLEYLKEIGQPLVW